VPTEGTPLEDGNFELAAGFNSTLAVTEDGRIFEFDFGLAVRPYVAAEGLSFKAIHVGWQHALGIST
jgi:hypothetical protein